MAIYLKQAVSEPVIEITVKKTMEPKQDQFGKTKFSAIVVYEGQEMWADFAEKFVGIIKNGSTVIGIRKEYQGKPYYEWAVKNTTTAKAYDAPKKTGTYEVYEDAKDVFAPKQDIQDRIIRGMCFNNACVIYTSPLYLKTIQESQVDEDIPMRERISNISKLLYKEMKEWLEGKD
jgi:hypothetical protein